MKWSTYLHSFTLTIKLHERQKLKLRKQQWGVELSQMLLDTY